MNSDFLSEYLECSVCLKPLDDQNKVLPCQHTFCKSCLYSIVRSHKELRCPECRIVVRQRVDDLPSNILLIRLLDGIRNQKNHKLPVGSDKPEMRRHSVEGILSEPVPATGGAKDGGLKSLTDAIHSSSLHERTNSEPATSKIMHSTAPKPHAVALYAYSSDQPSDLTFEKGDTIELLKKIDSNWMSGVCDGRTGVFPVNYVKIKQPLPAEPPYCVALYDFESDKDDQDRDCLHFSKNDRILVIRRVDNNWVEGILKDKIGIFPLAFVKLNEEAGNLLDFMSSPAQAMEDGKSHRSGIFGAAARRISSNKQGGKYTKKRHSFPILSAGKSKDDTSLSSSHRHSMELGVSATSANTNNSSSSDSSPPAPGLPKTTLFQKIPDLSKLRLKRQEGSSSFSRPVDPAAAVPSTSVMQDNPTPQKSTERAKSERPPSRQSSTSTSSSLASPLVPSKTVTASFAYQSQKFDELDLVKGESYRVTEVCNDGWCRGMHLRSRKSGVFPGNYVTPSPLASSTTKSSTIAATSSSAAYDRTYEQFRQMQQQMTVSEEDKLKMSISTKPPTFSTHLAPTSSTQSSSGSSSSTPLKPLTPTPSNKILNPFLPTSYGDPSAASSSKNVVSLSKASTSGKHPQDKIVSPKSPKPPRPAAPNVKLLSPRVSASDKSKENSGARSLRLLDRQHSTGKEMKSDKEKKRDRVSHHIFSKMMPGSSNGRKAKSSPPPRSSPSPITSSSSNQEALASSSNQNKPSVKPLARDHYRVTMNYPAQDTEELELREGDVVVVHSRRPDGWFRGTRLRNGKSGYFPSTFVSRIVH